MMTGITGITFYVYFQSVFDIYANIMYYKVDRESIANCGIARYNLLLTRKRKAHAQAQFIAHKQNPLIPKI